MGGNLINHSCYADDLTLIRLRSAGMEKLLAFCNNYGIEHELAYNSQNSSVICLSQTKFEKISYI